MDEFPIYFDGYPKVAELRRSADSAWLEPLRGHIRAMCDRAGALGIRPVFHVTDTRNVLLWDDENVHGSLRVQVVERDHRVIFVDKLPNFLIGDFTKYAVQFRS